MITEPLFAQGVHQILPTKKTDKNQIKNRRFSKIPDFSFLEKQIFPAKLRQKKQIIPAYKRLKSDIFRKHKNPTRAVEANEPFGHYFNSLMKAEIKVIS